MTNKSEKKMKLALGLSALLLFGCDAPGPDRIYELRSEYATAHRITNSDCRLDDSVPVVLWCRGTQQSSVIGFACNKNGCWQDP